MYNSTMKPHFKKKKKKKKIKMGCCKNQPEFEIIVHIPDCMAAESFAVYCRLRYQTHCPDHKQTNKHKKIPQKKQKKNDPLIRSTCVIDVQWRNQHSNNAPITFHASKSPNCTIITINSIISTEYGRVRG